MPHPNPLLRPLPAAWRCRSEDDLTHQLGEIIKANIRLKKQDESGAPQHIISEFALLLQVGRLGLGWRVGKGGVECECVRG